MTHPIEHLHPTDPSPEGRLGRAASALRKFVRRHRRLSGAPSLRTTVAILRAQQEATLDGILVVDPEGRVLSHNQRFLELWRIPEHVAAGGNDDELLQYASSQVENWEAFIAIVNHLYKHPTEVRTNDIVSLKDGRVLARTSVPVEAGNGQITGRAWYFRDVTESRREEQLRSALFQIAELSRSSERLEDFYAAVHSLVGELMNARNFFIAEYDAGRHVLTFPYFVDEIDPQPAEVNVGRGLTAYVIRTGQSVLVDPAGFEALVRSGEVASVGAPCLDWIGVPLMTSGRVWGVLGAQTYQESARYTESDRKVLQFVAQHVAAAIEQRRNEDALRASERRYRQMFENNRAVQLLIDPADGRLVDANVAASDFYGHSIEELRSLRIRDINILDPAEVAAEMALAATQKRSYFIFRHRLANGELRDVEVHSGPIDVGGRTLLYSIIHDITERRRAEGAVLASEEKYRNIFDFAPVGIYQSTEDGRLLTANPALARMLGYDSPEELLRRNLRDDIYVNPSDRDQVLEQFYITGDARDHELQWRKKDGSATWVQVSAHALDLHAAGHLFEGFVFDITERKRAEEMMRTHSAAMTASMDGIAILDEKLEFSYANDALAKLHGYAGAHHLLGQSVRMLYPEEEHENLLATILPAVQLRGRWRGESKGRRRDGALFPQEISMTAIEGGIVCVMRDVTERTYAEEQIKHLAYHDALTGLPNRLLFKDRLTVALSHAQRDRTRLAVLFLDLDRFKVINDSLGHNIGDQLLQAVAWRVQGCVRESDTVARLGGDEFTLLLPQLSNSEDGARVAKKILESVRHPFLVDGREFFISTSIGISLYPEDGVDAETLIKNADTAMYQAKEQGRDNHQLFNAYVNAKALQKISLEHGLRRALLNEELVVYYQPIFDFRASKITGMEALLRWQHPEYGLIPPGDFIPLAEATGLMVPIGLWVLRTACRHAKGWHDRGFRSLSLAVNLSVSQLQQSDLVERVGEILQSTGMPARLLELEITESSAMQSPENSIRTLYELKKLGLRISLDDFGTGHSSLAYLKRFPIDTLKIDQSFVRDITTDPDTAAIVSAIIAMTHSLRLKVIAEGVEFAEQAMLLKRYACDQMQGFLIKAPIPADDFERLLLETSEDLIPRVREG
jgi:diguanylate cyclase (GGDEF)-like protein/PAS domain S-box-containing protein